METAIRSGLKLQGNFELDCWRRFFLLGEEKLSDIPIGDIGMIFSTRRKRYELRRKVWTEKCHNLITDEGLSRILSVYFAGGTQTATWYCGLVETDTTPDAAI